MLRQQTTAKTSLADIPHFFLEERESGKTKGLLLPNFGTSGVDNTFCECQPSSADQTAISW
jgi:hypothetical protein